MTVIGDAVAGANFELSEPLAAHRRDAAIALASQGAKA
jgi:uroporphyrin-III C-methyltransferase/precorrin-2 dehydrogenase/sirohydrochlorin ferrochelatase